MPKPPAKITASRAISMLHRAMKEHLLDREFGAAQIDQLTEYFQAENIGGCFYCGSKSVERWDHLVPVKAGGATVLGNMVPACGSCDDSKGARSYTAWLGGKAKKNPARCTQGLLEQVVERAKKYQGHFKYTPPASFEKALGEPERVKYDEFMKWFEAVRSRSAEFGLID